MKKKLILAALLACVTLATFATTVVAMIPPIWECDLAAYYRWEKPWYNEQCYIAIMEQGGQIDP